MKIQDLLKPASIIINAEVETKEQAIAALIDKHDEAGNLTDKEVYTQGILKRESEGTTAIGEGIAIPHCKSDAVCNPGLAAMTVPGGIDYNAPDGQPSNLVFMIAAPMDGDLPDDPADGSEPAQGTACGQDRGRVPRDPQQGRGGEVPRRGGGSRGIAC